MLAALDHTHRQRDRPSQRHDDSGDDEQRKSNRESKEHENRDADDRPEAREPAAKGGANHNRVAVHRLEGSVENDALSDEFQDQGNDP